ncbi:MAG: PadR family transcriptional regulator [Anaerolineaceae bacterium]
MSDLQQVTIDRMMNEWKRGMFSFWALGLLLLRPMYGLEVKREIEDSTGGKIRLGASTIYQLLRRMEKRGLVTSRWQATSLGPPRAYYEPTPSGRAVIRAFTAEVLSIDSPISAGLGRLMMNLMKVFELENNIKK